jgi:hypothetical protein
MPLKFSITTWGRASALLSGLLRLDMIGRFFVNPGLTASGETPSGSSAAGPKP